MSGSELRVVFDTGVIVSAVLLPRSIPRRCFDLVSHSGCILFSDVTLTELHNVLRRPRFDRYVSENQRIALLRKIVEDPKVAGRGSPRERRG